VDIDVTAEPTTVQGDEALLQRLVANLVDNAVRYNDDRRQIRITLARGVLTVSNSGPAVPAEHLDDLFLPFRRLPEARTKSEQGAGLGLGIVASIATAHGAEVSAEANPTGGLTIMVCFTTT
jgi:signal transduction histidine kinase